MSGDMNKPEEVKRFDPDIGGEDDDGAIEGEFYGMVVRSNGAWVLFTDHAKALSAERTKTNALQHSLDHEMEVKGDFVSKCKALESKLKEAKVYVYEGSDHEAELLNKQNQQITALEAKVKELEAEIEMLTDNGDPLI